ncbi:MAG: hydroxyisourate hydrolase [Nitrospira sp.]|nr:hydroxyisourate hydrolase [Nitrospira sp.]
MAESRISTHVLDIAQGRPAQGMPVTLEGQGLARIWTALGKSRTDMDGRSDDLYPANLRLQAGIYRLTFEVSTYFRSQNVATFYPEVVVIFSLRDVTQPYHIPLLLSPFGYSTYRGS